MKYTIAFLLLAVALIAAAGQEPDTVAWRNGAWFDGTGFRRVDVYSIGETGKSNTSVFTLRATGRWTPATRIVAITITADQTNPPFPCRQIRQ